MFGKSLLKVGKNVIKKASPSLVDMALEVGQDIMKGRKLKNVAKCAFVCTFVYIKSILKAADGGNLVTGAPADDKDIPNATKVSLLMVCLMHGSTM